ncbi:MAG: hypothetical protein JRG74_07470 [Deltaproteobacteria bacterium]|nr:hypothetical protein [Deltaproteobacteria bacterium]
MEEGSKLREIRPKKIKTFLTHNLIIATIATKWLQICGGERYENSRDKRT